MKLQQVYPLYLSRFASALGTATLLTLLPTFIDMFTVSGVMIGLFTAAPTIARTFGVIPVGWAGDRYDKRTLLIGALGVSALAYGLFPFVASAGMFLVARLLQGVGILGTSLLGISLLGQLVPAERRARYIGRYNAWRMVAGIVGTIGVGFAVSYLGFGLIFGALVTLLGLGIIGLVLFVEPDTTTTTDFAFTDLALNETLIAASAFRLQHSMAVTLGRKWLPIFVGVSAANGGLGLGPAIVGVAIASTKVANMVCQPLSGRLSDRHGRELFLMLSGISYGVVLFAVPFAPEIGTALGLPETVPVFGVTTPAFYPLLVVSGLLGAADGLREPSSMALYADEGEGEGITSSFGLRSLAWRPGSIVAPLLGGYILSTFGMQWVFFFAGAVALSAVIVFVIAIVYLYPDPSEIRK